MQRNRWLLIGLAAGVALVGLAGFRAAADDAATTADASASGNPLAGTTWRLAEFQSMDDTVGKMRPSDPSRYTMQLNRDGTVMMMLNCNRAQGTWSAEPGADGASGRFAFGPLAATTAVCPPPSMDEHVMIQAAYVRGYLLRDGRLYLSLMADAGIYAWEPAGAASAQVPAAPEDGGPRNWAVTGVTSVLTRVS